MSLINLALGQVEQAYEFLEIAPNFERKTDLRIELGFPERGTSREVKDISDIMSLFVQTRPD
ncbi:MAG: hypothetical protein Q9N34_01330 [Aquificota bacterium]|nr:hypothetical protein [Aquificota bacterium]